VIGPAYKNVDAVVSKKIALHNDIKLEVRLEAYNVLNQINWANPNLTVLRRTSDRRTPNSRARPGASCSTRSVWSSRSSPTGRWCAPRIAGRGFSHAREWTGIRNNFLRQARREAALSVTAEHPNRAAADYFPSRYIEADRIHGAARRLRGLDPLPDADQILRHVGRRPRRQLRRMRATVGSRTIVARSGTAFNMSGTLFCLLERTKVPEISGL